MKPSHANRPTISSSTRPTNRPTVRPTIHSTRAGYWAHFAVSLLSCWLVSSSVLMMLDPLFRFRLPAGVLLLHALLLTAGMLLIARRWWVWPAVVGAGALVCAGWLLLTGRMPDCIQFIEGFFSWWAALFPRGSAYNTPENIALVQWIIHTGVCAGVCLLLHGIGRVWPAALAWGGLLTGVTVASFDVGLWAVALGFLGLLGPAAYSLLRSRRRVSLGSGGRAAMSLLALGAAAALLAAAVLPAATPYNPALNPQNWLRRNLTPELPFDNPLQEIGFADPAQLGGPVNLQDISLVLRVNTASPQLMRVQTFDLYTGRGWEADRVERYQVTDDMLAQLYGSAGPAHRAPETAEVTLLARTDYLPTCGLVHSLAAVQGDLRPQCNPRGEFPLSANAPAQSVYRFSFSSVDRAAIPAEYTPTGYVANSDLQLPDSLPDTVRLRAEEVTAAGKSPFSKMLLLESYLRENFRYTLSPANVPEGRDFVDYFLETGEGYCVYFATAMAVMARTLGVPARYIVGFGLEPDGDSYVARYSTAHAWVECYLGSDYGWVTFDPTAGAGFVDGVRPSSSGTGPVSDSTTTAPTSPTATTPSSLGDGTTTVTTVSGGTDSAALSTAPSDPSPSSPAPDGTGGGWALPRLVLAAVGLLALAAAAAFLAWRVTVFRTAYELTAVRRRFPDDTAAQMWWYYRDVKRQMALLGCPLKPGETLRQWASRAGSLVPEGFETALHTVEDALYRESDPSNEQIETMAGIRRALERELRRRLPWRRYVWQRFFRL